MFHWGFQFILAISAADDIPPAEILFGAQDGFFQALKEGDLDTAKKIYARRSQNHLDLSLLQSLDRSNDSEEADSTIKIGLIESMIRMGNLKSLEYLLDLKLPVISSAVLQQIIQIGLVFNQPTLIQKAFANYSGSLEQDPKLQRLQGINDFQTIKHLASGVKTKFSTEELKQGWNLLSTKWIKVDETHLEFTWEGESFSTQESFKAIITLYFDDIQYRSPMQLRLCLNEIIHPEIEALYSIQYLAISKGDGKSREVILGSGHAPSFYLRDKEQNDENGFERINIDALIAPDAIAKLLKGKNLEAFNQVVKILNDINQNKQKMLSVTGMSLLQVYLKNCISLQSPEGLTALQSVIDLFKD